MMITSSLKLDKSTIGILLMVLMVATSVVGVGQVSNAKFDTVYHLIRQKNFFKARVLYVENKKQLSASHQYFIEALLDNAFNKLDASNQKVTKLISAKKTLPDSMYLKLYRIKEDNSVKLYDYKEAKYTLQTVLKELPQLLTTEEKKDLENNLKIWTALENEPKQQIIINGPTRLKMKKDKAGLKNLKIAVGQDSLDFIFDTGANISTIAESAAKRLNMKIIPAGIDVDAVTGASVKADLAICKRLTLGSITIENSIFLVLADSALTFPQIKYQIYGILGFPVIEAFKEVQLTHDDHFIVPVQETKTNTASNMAIDGLFPLILIDDMHFTFDTGATETILYGPFYVKNQKAIEDKYKLETVRFSGAGGARDYKGFKINQSFNIFGKEVLLKNISLLKEKIDKESVYGNIGQDVINHFDKMTLNFDKMFILFN